MAHFTWYGSNNSWMLNPRSATIVSPGLNFCRIPLFLHEGFVTHCTPATFDTNDTAPQVCKQRETCAFVDPCKKRKSVNLLELVMVVGSEFRSCWEASVLHWKQMPLHGLDMFLDDKPTQFTTISYQYDLIIWPHIVLKLGQHVTDIIIQKTHCRQMNSC